MMLQLIAIAAVAFSATGGGGQPGLEDQRLTQLVTELLKGGVIVNEYEMTIAASQRMADFDELDQQKAKVFATLDALEQISQGDPARLAIYQEQRKLVNVGDGVLRTLKKVMEDNSGSRMSKMVIMYSGLRKLSSVSHKITENFEILIQPKDSKSSSIPVLPITAAVACAISLLLGGFLLTKAPVD